MSDWTLEKLADVLVMASDTDYCPDVCPTELIHFCEYHHGWTCQYFKDLLESLGIALPAAMKGE